ncbi:FtsB family cell division protein [Mesonia aestuariivivens]|uniref:Septum formation initiator family protein n=1 Tax=Mesonia aestuariivivens TaxID=2796128 RepID=A0ABS6W1W0_9FLAO|nr:septum formation initiator family protein [Mesonia aestuariivivens]MBW2961138.1 septum formation initiator family protein [Mesonia aestuariivivens]
MGFKKLREKRWFKIVSNKYVLIILVFGVWMLFLDSNSWLVHRELDEELDKLNNNKTYYEKEINKDKTIIEGLNDADELEKFAREEYFMKREDEEIFIIEYQDGSKKEDDYE